MGRQRTISPFVVLLIVALIFQYIPIEGQLKRIGYIVIGIVAILMLLRFVGISHSYRQSR